MPDETLDNEKELMKLISDGDEIAFAKLFSHYRNRIYSIAFKLTKSYVIAEEIVQDVFLKIWLKRANLNDIQNFSGYLFIVTRNNAYKVLKGIAGDYKIISVAEEDQKLAINDTADLLMEKEYKLVLQSAIERLPNQQKQVYTLVREHGLSRDEVANKMQIRPDTVKFHLAQAMKKIRAFCMLYIGTFTGFTIFLSHLFRNN